jgi:hypothetical protein
MAYGMLIFRSIAETVKAGFQVYDRTPSGYIVRTKTGTMGRSRSSS